MTNTKKPMKRIKCPDCGLTLGVPTKVFDKPFECPKCKKPIVASQEGRDSDIPLPFPELALTTRRGPEPIAAPLVEKVVLSVAEVRNETKELKPGRVKRKLPKPEPVKPATVARIIKVESVETSLANEGQLPTLQLKDNRQMAVSPGEVSKSPMFLVVLVCSSLLASGLIIFMASRQSATREAALIQARAEISKYYHTRIDVELKPYQLELRAAQLAHSRGDRDAEIAAYRKVMTRFHAEDRNQFVGVTGSPSEDQNLERLVSTMLRGR